MLLDKLKKYLEEVDIVIRQLKDIYIERYEEEIISDERVNLRIRIRFLQGQLLEMNEAVICERNHIRHLNYRYHFQNKQNVLIFRYDNTPHFPDIESFPHNKHIEDKVIKTKQPSIFKVIEEAKGFIK